ncbi:hypothetical protein ACHAXA_009277 [Cyclostephanos tholiformis]|uniref:PH domain-containing protein n=1 Tax=Cyclostephanos tholiformis TaxID=382380 RepID=A0ABD3RE16_9STRA
MVNNAKNEEPPIILEQVAWKLRGGFGKYSTSLGAGPSWERRRIALTERRLNYYAKVSKGANDDNTPRGTLDVSSERATISATYPGDSSQPTPYAIAIKVVDAISQGDVTKWKICFDDRETQLLWLVALTDIVADASVREYNGGVLMASADRTRYDPGGFHRLYEEGGGGRLLDLVHGALTSSGRMRGGPARVDGEEIEVVRRSLGGLREIHVVEGGASDATAVHATTQHGNEIVFARHSPIGMHVANDDAFDARDDDERYGRSAMHDERTFHALAVVVATLILEKVANLSSSMLWKTVTFIIMWIFLHGSNEESSSKGKSRLMAESCEMRSSTDSSNQTANFTRQSTTGDSSSESMNTSMVRTELMKSEGVPLSEESSRSFVSPKRMRTVRDESRLDRPLTVDEMRAHAHERWAVSAPDVDLSGEWTLIADDTFKQEYDAYLKRLGFSGITRRVACSLISRTTEITKQSHSGRELFLKGVNPKGAWERVITASGYPDFDTDSKQEDYSHVRTTIKTADSEDVDAEAWWEELGTKHRSWLRGGKKYGGGDFESLRYLEEGSNGSVLVCESTFHPNDIEKELAVVTWRFKRH